MAFGIPNPGRKIRAYSDLSETKVNKHKGLINPMQQKMEKEWVPCPIISRIWDTQSTPSKCLLGVGECSGGVATTLIGHRIPAIT